MSACARDTFPAEIGNITESDFPLDGSYRMPAQRTRWLNHPNQTFEIEASLDRRTYVYRLVIESRGEPSKAWVAEETVTLNAKPLFEFVNGEVRLYNGASEHSITYPFDQTRSALALASKKDNPALIEFMEWFGEIGCFRINPFLIGPRAEGEDPHPLRDLSNFAAWYRHLIQDRPQQNEDFLSALRSTFDDFDVLRLEAAGENVRLLGAELVSAGSRVDIGFGELSDGQRCLIGLYAILHFVITRGGTVIIDEPDNFISLREIQPWLMAVDDAIDDHGGQVLIISHHPELINQWAPSYGVTFVRDGVEPVRVERLDAAGPLLPSEVVARGWERG